MHIDFCQIPLTSYLLWGGVSAFTVLENLRNERISIKAFQKIKNYRKRFMELGERASQRPSLEQPEMEFWLVTTPIAVVERILSSSQYRTAKKVLTLFVRTFRHMQRRSQNFILDSSLVSVLLHLRKPPHIRKPPLLGTNRQNGGAFLYGSHLRRKIL